jgi:DNA-binding transcriptional ArsR family regulator
LFPNSIKRIGLLRKAAALFNMQPNETMCRLIGLERNIRIMDLKTFSALAEPSRFRIVDALLGGPLNVGDIADRLQLSQPQASKHLHVLLESGLVEVQAVANRRNFNLRMEPFQALDAWLETYRGMWEQ